MKVQIHSRLLAIVLLYCGMVKMLWSQWIVIYSFLRWLSFGQISYSKVWTVNCNTKNIHIRWSTESSDCLNRLCIQANTTCTEHAYVVCTSEIRCETNLWTNEKQTLGRFQVLNQSIHAHVDAISTESIKLKLQLNFDSQISFGLDTNRSVFYGPAIVAVLYINRFPFGFVLGIHAAFVPYTICHAVRRNRITVIWYLLGFGF